MCTAQSKPGLENPHHYKKDQPGTKHVYNDIKLRRGDPWAVTFTFHCCRAQVLWCPIFDTDERLKRTRLKPGKISPVLAEPNERYASDQHVKWKQRQRLRYSEKTGGCLRFKTTGSPSAVRRTRRKQRWMQRIERWKFESLGMILNFPLTPKGLQKDKKTNLRTSV